MAPQAIFTPIAAGLRPLDDPISEIPDNLRAIIHWAISHGIASGLQQRHPNDLADCEILAAQCQNQLNMEFHTSWPNRPESPSLRSELSIMGEEGQRELDILEDEGLTPDIPAFTGLFPPALFRSLLFKARSTSRLHTVQHRLQTDPGLSKR